MAALSVIVILVLSDADVEVLGGAVVDEGRGGVEEMQLLFLFESVFYWFNAFEIVRSVVLNFDFLLLGLPLTNAFSVLFVLYKME